MELFYLFITRWVWIWPEVNIARILWFSPELSRIALNLDKIHNKAIYSFYESGILVECLCKNTPESSILVLRNPNVDNTLWRAV